MTAAATIPAAGAAPTVQRLVGFDTAGEPFVSGDRVFRGIYKGHAAKVREVLAVCLDHDLFRHGIVSTRELDADPHPELGYEMVLEHRRIPFVTYPHEWPASMFREAARFHIELFERLQEHGLTLKDWHPYNILFDATQPVFVDFTSIVPIADLPHQSYLSGAVRSRLVGAGWDASSTAIYEMYRLMYEPYFGLPLAMMQDGRPDEARVRLFHTTLNAADSVIARREAFVGRPAGRLRYEFVDWLLQAALTEKGPAKHKFFSRLRKTVDGNDVAVRGSAYSTYYEEKSEAFAAEPVPEWTNKQRVVHDALVRFAPSTVLDLGSNTGWFSMLAAKLGSSVVSVDLDEACIDRLFVAARRDNLPILPLVANLTAPLPELRARVYADEPSRSMLGDGGALIRSPVERLQCDMVLALAVAHHLSLGQALTFAEIASILSSLTRRYLCVEFVSIDDPMIATDPAFFPAYNAARDQHGWYTQENFAAALGEHFSAVEILPSHPDSRTLLICSK